MRKVWSHDWIVCPGMRARELSDKGDKSPVALVAALAIKRTEAQSREIASLLIWVAVALIECDVKRMCKFMCWTKNKLLSFVAELTFYFYLHTYTKHFQIASSQVDRSQQYYIKHET